ncbi:MAG: SUMF1/EgtB/PvdO family nonheme iron enzyme [Gemmatimonadetes bacterium]|nr:SUMF1/EgtB/PvdO family nonheme iron enzyme [Gemmatimonadota bacterium]MBT4613399.1 SUMF1/EgtB/PvdO family nonheme iron enzyme [Gemmatimonadota bacterium]MBT5055565.1 SUMF1/EgtB/PvdO family nonheme iron enzyme [Gemmatimonadota bacterium]MBT5143913.1 SUMF1/EgtB/PvdO family nonheme iron enzyme [Gemmatimonadota bacterium]MBT5588648.1 SUMF1/EgtB/PvdO family nonheme iron enzyme [Gemmatimonadota bacterium]
MIRSLWLLATLLAGCSLFNQELPNVPPKVEVSTADTLRVARGGSVSFEVSASDKDDDPLDYSWSALGAGSFSDSVANITTWRAPDLIASHSEFFLITVTITDHQPDTEDILETFLVEVVQQLPVLSVASVDTVISFREPALVLAASATDADGDDLEFIWELLEGSRTSLQIPESEAGQSEVTLISLVPTQLKLLLSVSDGSDTVSQEILASVEATNLPDGGTVTLERRVADGTMVSYEMDVYEYPNQRGVLPTIVDNWFEARALCEAKDMRLCSSHEWIDACQGPEEGFYSSTDDPDNLPEEFGLRFCNTVGSDLIDTENVELNTVGPSGSFPNCTSPDVGVYDLTGNAFEWTEDFDPFQGRVGGFSLSGAIIRDAQCGQVSEMEPLPFADELNISDEAVVDSLLSLTTYSAYRESNYGFRCCR